MKRRDFIKDSAILVAAAGAGNALKAADRSFASLRMTEDGMTGHDENAAGGDGEGKLITSAPMLQNYAEESIGVGFAVGAMANGYVLVSESPDMSGARKIKCGGYRLTEISDKVSQIRVTGLKPSTKYYYKIGADRIHYGGGYDMKILGNEEDPVVYSFTTAGKGSDAHFCVINDTHVHWPGLEKTITKVNSLAPSCVIWNGDASNTQETIESQIEIFLDPKISAKDYASRTPYLFSPGNHDSRGMANRHLERVWMYRQPEERAPRDWDLGRNFAVRMGDVALIGLDTAEDKMDTNPLFAGLFNSDAYRRAQVAWLRDALKRKDIAKAPYLVAFCHIPLFDSDPKANPGDLAPADKDPRYSPDFAIWQRTCAELWTPLLEKAHCQLIITAHQHEYRRDDPAPGRSWTQLVGGGPRLEEKHFPTVIEGKVEGGRLNVTVHNILTGQVEDQVSFVPRKR